MPELILGGLDEWALIRVFILMLHPNDADKREELLATAVGQVPAEPIKEKPAIYRALENAFQNLTSTGRPNQKGLLSGRVLVALKAMFDHSALPHGRVPSLDTAQAIVAEEDGCSPSTVQKAWISHKSVAHLWAGLEYCGQVMPGFTNDGIELRRFPDWLGASEAFGEFALTTKLHDKSAQTKKAIFNLGDVWNITGEFDIPHTTLSGLILSQNALTILKNYRARARR